MNRTIRSKLKQLPHQSGVYIFRDGRGRILYVGKAAKLRHRVRSYFQSPGRLTAEKQSLVRNIADIETVITTSETEALLLEATLIKRHQPPHNIVLRDDKSYLYVRIGLADPYPPVALVRTVRRDRARYFGPYTSAAALRSTMKLLRRALPYRQCDNPPDRPCFDAQLGRCAGHDLNSKSRSEYQQLINELVGFLRGRRGRLVRTLRADMRRAAAERQYEAAAVFRDRLQAIERVQAEQKVVIPRGGDEDFISLVSQGGVARFNLFRVRAGKLVSRDIFTVQAKESTAAEDVLTAFIEQYYAQSPDHPAVVYLPFLPRGVGQLGQALQLTFRVPARGRKRKLLRLGEENARHALARLASLGQTENRRAQALRKLARAIGLSRPLRRIEAYDVSNLQGVSAVAAMVVFADGLPKPAAYRKFTIKTVPGADDYRMLAEAVGRRLAHPEWPRPDLMVIDGGPGQLKAVQKVVRQPIPMIALAKREELVYLPGRKSPLKLPRDSEALFLLQRIRDEAHRFAVGFFRHRHERASWRSQLDEINGIGPKTKKILREHYGSLAAIRQAKQIDLVKLIGRDKAKRLQAGLSE